MFIYQVFLTRKKYQRDIFYYHADENTTAYTLF